VSEIEESLPTGNEPTESPTRTWRVQGDSSTTRSRLWYLLLAVSFVALLWVPFYARGEPELFGVPFFYWYQFAWVPNTAVLTWLVYVATRPRIAAGPRVDTTGGESSR
jgi:uncharacterized membrane protein